MVDNYYQIWDWENCPGSFLSKTSIKGGTWVVKYPFGYTFPLNEIHLSEHPEYEVELINVGTDNIVFIKDPNKFTDNLKSSILNNFYYT